jgi:transcriptional regulator with XRE-family HTH domain
MPHELSKLVRDAIDAKGVTQAQLALQVMVSQTKLSKLVRRGEPPSIDEALRIGNHLGLSVAEVVSSWTLDQTKTESARDQIRREYLSPRSPGRDNLTPLTEGLKTQRNAYHVASGILKEFKKIRKAIDASEHEMIVRLSELDCYQVIDDKRVRVVETEEDTGWEKLPGSQFVDRKRLLLSITPSPFLAEVHRFPPLWCGLHRQAKAVNGWTGHEFWSTVSGAGKLIVQADGPPEPVIDVKIGVAGAYWAGFRHLWINPSKTHPLVVFHVIFPFQESAAGNLEPGEACEAQLPDLEGFNAECREMVLGALR